MTMGINTTEARIGEGVGVIEISGYTTKIIKSGDIVEVYRYEIEQGVNKTYPMERLGRSSVASDEDKKSNRGKVLRRAKVEVERLINANYSTDSKFVTVTYRDNITDVAAANSDFKNFIKRVEYKIKDKLKYLAVTGFQNRGSVHYHVVAFNLSFMSGEELTALWKNGNVKMDLKDMLWYSNYNLSFMAWT